MNASCSILVSKSFSVFLAISEACLSSVRPKAWDLCRDGGMAHRALSKPPAMFLQLRDSVSSRCRPGGVLGPEGGDQLTSLEPEERFRENTALPLMGESSYFLYDC